MSAVSVEVLRATFANNERIRVMKHHAEKCAERKSPIDPIALARVRKNLFAQVEPIPTPNALFIEQELRRIEMVEKERWNFDFANEKPVNSLRGMYKWEAYVKPPVKRIVVPKPRRVAQGKITDFMTKRKGLKRGSDSKPSTSRDQGMQTEPSQSMQVD